MNTFKIFVLACALLLSSATVLDAQERSRSRSNRGERQKQERVYKQNKRGNQRHHERYVQHDRPRRSHRHHHHVVYERPRPPRVVYVQPVRPAPDYFWVEPHWAWDDYAGHYVWVNGYWEPMRPGYRYVPGRWIAVEGGGFTWQLGVWIRL